MDLAEPAVSGMHQMTNLNYWRHLSCVIYSCFIWVTLSNGCFISYQPCMAFTEPSPDKQKFIWMGWELELMRVLFNQERTVFWSARPRLVAHTWKSQRDKMAPVDKMITKGEPEFSYQNWHKKPGVMTHTQNHSTGDAETGSSLGLTDSQSTQ